MEARPAPEVMPFPRRLLYSLGAAGWQLTDRLVVSVALFYYLPPPGRGLEDPLSPRIFLGVFTVYGVASLVGRVFDMLADPVVGWASDRSRSRLGRRRIFLAGGILPMVALPVLLFWPPGAPGSTANALWLAGILALYFVFFTVYVGPYLALLPEIARSTEERVNLSTLMAVATLPAAIFGGVYGLGIDWGVARGLAVEEALRALVLAASALALVLCALPLLAVDERRFCRGEPSSLSIREALGATFANRPFRRYLAAQIPFIVGVNMVQPALIYYATVVLGRSEGFTAPLGGVLMGATILAFVPVNRLARRYGPKRSILACVAGFGVGLALLGLLRPDVPGGPHDAANLLLVFGVMACMGAPLAGFVTLPNVLISQVIDFDTHRTGAHRAAMYFGAQGLATKLLYGVSGAILAFLFQRFGNSAEDPLGVLLVGPVAGAFCGISALLFLRYPERSIQVPAVEPVAGSES